ncbi:CHAD domain-containing protein [Agromyces sp. MMS24-K17]|uniref:CHAD domain-containing protein n=1 Tax=Agromyces sp. MMS24-K17 TaxID=3372850 RepID=UPI0037542E60
MSRADDSGTDAATTAGAVVAVLRRYGEELPPRERAAAADEPDGVHQARILVRRLRSVLGAARDVFEEGAAERVRDRFERLGDDLGEVRDLEVRILHAEEHVAPGADATVVERLILRERDRYREAHAELVAVLDGAADVHAALAALVGDPPVAASKAGVDAEVGLTAILRHEIRRVRRAERHAFGDLDSLHRLRRTARRLRYTVEAFTEEPADLLGDDVRALGAAAKDVQDVLGDHRDALLFALQVRRAEADARAAGEPADDYARIADDAFAAATERIEALPEALRAFHGRADAVAG